MIDLLAGIFIGIAITVTIILVLLFWGQRYGVFEILVHETSRSESSDHKLLEKLRSEISELGVQVNVLKSAKTPDLELLNARLTTIETALAPYLNKKE